MTPRDDESPPEFRELLEQVRHLPRSIQPGRDLLPGVEARIAQRRALKAKRLWWGAAVPLAAAAILVLALALRSGSQTGTWVIRTLAGRPLVGGARLGGSGRLHVGDWVSTDDSSRALIAVGDIGVVEVKPGSRIRLVQALATEHRLALDRGSISAKVDAPPRLFFVDTRAGTAIDLGCAYTLTMDSAGNGRLRVTAGYVEFQWQGRRAIVPIGASVETRPGYGPGVPVVADAPAPLVSALAAFDFARGGGGAAAVRGALASARPEDAMSVWHLLERVDQPLRGSVYDRLVTLVPPPQGVTRDAVLRLDRATLDRYWEAIRRIAWRREILRGVKDIDPRTGTAVERETGKGKR